MECQDKIAWTPHVEHDMIRSQRIKDCTRVTNLSHARYPKHVCRYSLEDCENSLTLGTQGGSYVGLSMHILRKLAHISNK